jgi:hypothetical protein
MLVPIQQYLEHKTISYLHSRKKKYSFSIKKWWQRQKKPTTATINEIEKDTAVL